MINLKVFTEYSYDKSIIKFNDYTEFILKNNLNYISISDDNFKSLYKLKKFIEKNPNIKPIIGQEYEINGLDFYLIAKNNRGLKKMIEFSNATKKTLKFLRENEENIIICFGKPTKRNIKNLMEKKDKLKKALKDIDFFSLIYKEEGINIFYNKLIKSVFHNKTLEIGNIVYLEKKDLKIYNNYLDIMKYHAIDNYNEFILDSRIPFYDEITVDLKYIFNDDYNSKFDFDETKEIKRIVNKKIKNIKNDEVKKETIARLTKEFKLIEQKNFSGFIYVIYDLINYMKKEKILYNNRGSAGSSLVLYLLDIVLLNPLKYDFYFERFINEFRNELPDIDLDVQEDKIEQVLNYLVDKYSSNNIGKIITYSNFQFKSLTRRVLSSLGVENTKITQITSKMINKYNNKVLTYDLLTKIINNQNEYDLTDEEFIKYKDFYDYINNLFKYYPKLYSSLNLIGNIYQQSKHSSGIIICNRNINATFPVLKKDGILNIQFDKKDIENINIIKLDLLNSVILKIISKTMKKAELPYEWFYSKKLNDPLVYKEFSKGNTQCVFQFSSNTGKKVLKGSEVISFQDLFNRNACDRPGPLSKIPGEEKTLVEMYFDNKNDDKNIKSFNGILKNTYGCLIFQEQVLKISQKIAGYSLAEADQKVRKNISSKNIEKINALEKEFVNSSIENGYSKEVSKRTFNYLVNFSKYGFNKPHAAIYSYIAYKTMELKIYYKNIYLNEYLKNSKKKEIKEIFGEIGEKIINLNINHSKYQTIIYDKNNYLGFNLIKNFTIDDYKKILKLRPIKNPNQLKNILTNTKIENLIKSGTFDFLNENRFMLLNNLFENNIYNVDDYNFYEQIKFEKESTGINFFNNFSELPDDIKNKQNLILKGIIDFVDINVDKNNNEYAKLKVLLNNKTTYVVIFNDKYIEYKDSIKKGHVINFEGIYNKKFNNINLRKII